jgi:uncharacterized protein YdaU (DUF1376 family)
MSRTPYMPLFIEPFLADTAGLSLEEQGAYIRLLCHMWLNGGKVVDNEKIIARILGVHVNKWRKIRENLGSYLPSNPPGYLSNPRLQRELDRVHDNRMKKTLAAQTRWSATELKNNRSYDASASDLHLHTGCGCICTCMRFASHSASVLQPHIIIIYNKYNLLDLIVGGSACGKLSGEEVAGATSLACVPLNRTVH